jgi:hypothetical protein
MKKLTASLAALALAACNAQKADPAQAYRDVLPQAAKIQIGTPSAQTNPGALTSRQAAAGGAPAYQSEYARVSYWTAVTVNVGVWWTLTLVKVITAYPPSPDCNDTACTWGPWLGDDHLNEWKFHADKVGDHFEYKLSAGPVADPSSWSDILTGIAFPGVDRDHGKGSFTVNFDNFNALPHPAGWAADSFGVLDVTYDNRTELAITAAVTNGKSDDPTSTPPYFDMNATYSFLATGTGGDLQLGIVNLDTRERLSLNTRWVGTGAGRGDVDFIDAQAAEYRASECWAGEALGWVKVYDDKTVPAFGTESLCAFSPGVFNSPPPLP